MKEITIAILGILVGGMMQYWFDVRHSKKDKILELKANAYADFLKSLSETTFAQRSNDKARENQGFSLMVEAKARICIYGEPEVVSSLANFWRSGASLCTPIQYQAFIKLVQSMRESGFAGGKISSDDISQIIIGEDLINP